MPVAFVFSQALHLSQWRAVVKSTDERRLIALHWLRAKVFNFKVQKEIRRTTRGSRPFPTLEVYVDVIWTVCDFSFQAFGY